MSDEVPRYEIDLEDRNGGVIGRMTPDPAGRYVLHSDYQALASRLDEALRLLRDVQKDLVDRAQPDREGVKVVQLSQSVWDRLDGIARPLSTGERIPKAEPKGPE